MVVRFQSKHHRIAAVRFPANFLPPGALGHIAWQRVIEQLYTLSNAVETITPGVAVLSLHPELFPELRALFPAASCGLANTCEHALLAAQANMGVVQQPNELFKLALHHVPAGFSDDELERLRWLGVHTIGHLHAWSATQIHHVLGPTAARVLPFVHGPARAHLAPDPKPTAHTVRYQPTAALHEPHEWLPILNELVRKLHTRLAGHGSRFLELATDGHTYGTIAKWELAHIPELRRAFERLALQHTGAFPSLALTAFSVTNIVQQGTLWHEAQPAAELAHELALRFPGQIMQCRWLDPASEATDLGWEWHPRV